MLLILYNIAETIHTHTRFISLYSNLIQTLLDNICFANLNFHFYQLLCFNLSILHLISCCWNMNHESSQSWWAFILSRMRIINQSQSRCRFCNENEHPPAFVVWFFILGATVCLRVLNGTVPVEPGPEHKREK